MANVNKSRSETLENDDSVIRGQTNPSFYDNSEVTKECKFIQSKFEVAIKKPSFVLKPSILTQKAEELRTDKEAVKNTFGNSTGENKFLVLGNYMKSEINDKSLSEDCVKIEPSKGFIFGQNIFERVVATEGNQEVEEVKEFKDLAGDNGVEKNNGDVDGDALRKNAEVATQRNTTKSLQETEMFTGEEDELSILKMSCKLFLFNNDRKEWVEKGFCFVHVNDSNNSSKCKSRLVVRSKGGLKVIINTFIWPDMVLTKASRKSLRISSQGEDGVKSYLLTMLNINDADTLYHELSYRKSSSGSPSTVIYNRKRDFSSSDNDDELESKRRIYSDDDE